MSSVLDRGDFNHGLTGYGKNKIVGPEVTIVDGDFLFPRQDSATLRCGSRKIHLPRFSKKHYSCSCPVTGPSCIGRYGCLVGEENPCSKVELRVLPPSVSEFPACNNRVP